LQFLQLQGEVDDTQVVVFDDSIARNLNRLRVADLEDDSQDLPETVQWRLFLARQLAVLSA
jgi:hypothetical protein